MHDGLRWYGSNSSTYSIYIFRIVDTKDSKYTKEEIGVIYPFILKKTIILPPNEQEYFLIEDSDMNKFTIPASIYKHYNFIIGKQLHCKLDRINCNGEIFFEPLNPYYIEKKVYPFTFVKKLSIKNAIDIIEDVVVVSDIFQKEHWVRLSSSIKIKGDKINAFIWKIKKGRLFLIPENQDAPVYLQNSNYEFKIIEEYYTERFGKCYKIVDSYGNEHAIPKDYYVNFNLRVGEYFNGTIVRFSSKGFFYIEPNHPIYKVGNSYKFEIFNRIKENKRMNYFLLDCFGDIIKIQEQNDRLKIGDTIVGKVLTLRKGKPSLEII